MKFDLQPHCNVEASLDGGFAWKSSNNDPQFLIGDCEELKGRAVRVSFKLNANPALPTIAILYVDTGTGISEKGSIRLVVPKSGVVDEEIAFPKDLCDLRFDPLDYPGLFSVEKFNMEFLDRSPDEIEELIEASQRRPPPGARIPVGEAIDRLGCRVTQLTYENWIAINEIPERDYDKLRAQVAGWESPPLISVLMPTYQTPEKWLRKAIDSVISQVYQNWELCIADDMSPDANVRKILDEYRRKDARIKVVCRPSNGHISAASNTALAECSGVFTGLLDHDDELHPLALFYVSQAIREFPEVGIIYSDEDKISVAGERSDPYFKTAFNYDLFLGQNMVGHFSVYRTAVLKAIGGFREGLEGSQDYDLALRALDEIGAANVHHIPRVLYHWRVIPESTASSQEAKPYAIIAATRALTEHLVRNGIAGAVELSPNVFAYNKVSYEIPAPPPSVEIIIPTRDSASLVRQCIDSITAGTTYANFKITIIDNGSIQQETFDLFDVFRKDARIRIVTDHAPFNYSALNNRVAFASQADFVCLMNNDIEVITPGWLNEMLSIACQPGVGAVGAKLLYPDDTLQHAGVIIGVGGIAGHSHKHMARHAAGYFSRLQLRSTMSAVTAACLLIRTSIFREVDGLDEKLQIAFNDVDFCLRVQKAGYRNVWTPYAELYHHESATRGYEDTPEKVARFQSEVVYVKQRWGSALLNDPCYSPNLTLESEDFAMAWHSRVSDPF